MCYMYLPLKKGDEIHCNDKANRTLSCVGISSSQGTSLDDFWKGDLSPYVRL